jgi:hypothetical protein
MFIPIAKILKGKRVEKGCLLLIYISIFSCLAVYNKDNFVKLEPAVLEENVSNLDKKHLVLNVSIKNAPF